MIDENKAGSLQGTQLEARYIASLSYKAGWTDAEDLLTAVCVCLAESQGYTRAFNDNPDGTRDRGIWQLNTIHKDITDDMAYDPVQATPIAFKLWKNRGDFGDWAAFTSKVYLRDTYIKKAGRGVANFLAEELMNRPTDTLSGQPYVHGQSWYMGPPTFDYQYRVNEMLGSLGEIRAKLNAIGSASTKTLADARSLAHDAAVICGNAQQIPKK